MPPETIIDLRREERQGFPEVVYGKGKTPAQIADAVRQLIAGNGHALATGVSEEAASIVKTELGLGDYDPCSRLYRIGHMTLRPNVKPPVVISAGTSDQSVAEEAAQTLEFCGYGVIRVRDVGVAGLHRLLDRIEVIRQASVVIVVAGMEGALASVVGGLIAQPIIAVPTSIGYGASFQGLAALLAMLNSCAAGITVTNIDNGFGAAIAAHRILQRSIA